MRKLMALLMLGGVFLAADSSMAINKRNTGCGLGYILFKDQKGKLAEILAATTNATLLNQTFGITFGTLECEDTQAVSKNEKLNRFVAENMDELAQDIARGEGMYVNTLADLMNVPEERKPEFYTKLQNNFERIFPSENVSSAHVIKAIASL